MVVTIQDRKTDHIYKHFNADSVNVEGGNIVVLLNDLLTAKVYDWQDYEIISATL